jgi:hypothetical protein
MTDARSTRRIPDDSSLVASVKFDRNVYRRKPLVKAYIASYILYQCPVQIWEQYRGPFVAKIMYVLEQRLLTFCSLVVLAGRATRVGQTPTRPSMRLSNTVTAEGTRYRLGSTARAESAIAIMFI